jgi:hypothetical protein
VTITLREGPSGNLRDVKVITDQAKDGSFTWTPDNDVKNGRTYAFQVSQQDETNYTALLHSAGEKPVDTPENKATTTGATGTAHTTAASATGTTGATSGTTSQTTAGIQTTDVTSSKALISSSASGSASPSSSAAASTSASSSDVPMITDISNGKEASSTASVQTDAASIPQSSMKFVLGVAGLLVYLVQ